MRHLQNTHEKAVPMQQYDCGKCGGFCVAHPNDAGKRLAELLCPVCLTPLGATQKYPVAISTAAA